MGKTNAHEKNSELINKLEKQAMDEVDSLNNIDEHHKEKAKLFIITNAFSVRNYLEKIKTEGLPLGENFKVDQELSDKNTDYNFYTVRIAVHQNRVRKIPEILKNEGYRAVIQMHS